MFRVLGVLLLLWAPSNAFANNGTAPTVKGIVNLEGRKILLYEDGTWKYVEKNTADEKSIKGNGYEAVVIPKGSFEMGCTSEQGSDCWDNEKPSHQVTISNDFYIMKSEVTQELYQNIMGRNPSGFRGCGEDCPVEKVTWYDAIEFANALSEKEKLEPCYSTSGEYVMWPKGVDCTGWRLPTEAEWEFAARGPSARTDPATPRGEMYKYAGSNNINEVAWYGYYLDPRGTSKEKTTHPVCSKNVNGYGLCDMSGNVFEWVWDWYGENYYQSTSVTDPTGPSTGSDRIYRGGGWRYDAGNARTPRRFEYQPSLRYYDRGFRLSRTIR